MLKKCFVAAAILLASPAFASAQDIFWSFSPTELVTSVEENVGFNGETGSVYIFSDGLFGFDALDLEFTSSDSVIRFTGGEAFNPTFNVIGRTRFDSSEIIVDAFGSSGGLFAVNVTQNGVNPVITELFDPGFDAGVGPNGTVLLARVDFDVVGDGAADLEFGLGPQGALQLPQNILNPSFGSATFSATFAAPKVGYCTGDVNRSGDFPFSSADIDFSDVPPFIALLATGGFQQEADCNGDGVVNFFDIAPFILLLPRN